MLMPTDVPPTPPRTIADELDRPIMRWLFIAFLAEVAAIGAAVAWIQLVTRGVL